MRSRPKEHRAPVRYSLHPGEVRQVISSCQSRGSVSDKQISVLARKFGCSRKTIHDIVTRTGISVLTSQPNPPEQAKARNTKSRDTIDPTPEPAPADRPQAGSLTKRERDALDYLSQEEEKIRQDFAERESELLDAASELETQLDKRNEKLDEQTVKVRAALEQTRNLRRETRKDRDLIESLRGELTYARHCERKALRQLKDLEEVNRTLKAELHASATRERKLLNALKISENDLLTTRRQSPVTR